MKKLFVQLERELKAYFLSPIAYIVLCFLLAMTGVNFWFCVLSVSGAESNRAVSQLFFGLAPWLGGLFAVPLLTMRLFSEEYRMGTIEPLSTSPIGDLQIVLAKYLAALAFYILTWAPTYIYFLVYERSTDVSAGAIWSSYLLMLLIGMFNLSIGCLASALTRNQIIAAVGSFAAVMIFFFLGFLKVLTQGATPLFRDIIDYFSAFEYLASYTQGIIDSRAIVYYLSMTCFMLYLTFQAFQFRKWRP